MNSTPRRARPRPHPRAKMAAAPRTRKRPPPAPPSAPAAEGEARPVAASTGAALVAVPPVCDFDRVDSTSMFDTLGGIRALQSGEASRALTRCSLAELRGYETEDLMAIAEIGYHYLRSGGARLATVIFEGLTALKPDEAYFWLALGLSRDHAGQSEGARAAYEEATRRDPADATPEINLAELELEAGRRPAARTRLRRAAMKATRAGQGPLLRKAEAIESLLGA